MYLNDPELLLTAFNTSLGTPQVSSDDTQRGHWPGTALKMVPGTKRDGVLIHASKGTAQRAFYGLHDSSIKSRRRHFGGLIKCTKRRKVNPTLDSAPPRSLLDWPPYPEAGGFPKCTPSCSCVALLLHL